MNRETPERPWTDVDDKIAGEAVLPLAEERVRVDKRVVERGRVRVRTVTDVTEEIVREELAGVGFEVTRVPRDQIIGEGEPLPAVRKEGDVTILPVLEEVLVVERRLMLKEELRIARRDLTDTVEIPVTLRRQRAIIERIAPEDGREPPTSTQAPTEE